MKLKYYGTGAGGGMPDKFCSCRVCENARQVRGKELRTRSQAVLDEKIGIDFPVDVFTHVLYGGFDPRKVYNYIITHAHFDHFLHQEFSSRAKGQKKPYTVYATELSATNYKPLVESHAKETPVGYEKIQLAYCQINQFEPFYIEDYRITPLRARHPQNVQSVIFVIEHGGKAILWAHDTGYFPDDTWDYLEKNRVNFDFISLDCTLKRGERITPSHMDIEQCAEVTNRLRKLGMADENTRIYLSHIGHLVAMTHTELEEAAKDYGFQVAYDGLEVEF